MGRIHHILCQCSKCIHIEPNFMRLKLFILKEKHFFPPNTKPLETPTEHFILYYFLSLCCVLCTVYCVLCTVCCVLCAVYCVLCAVYCVLWSVYCVLCTVYCVLCTVYCMCTVSRRRCACAVRTGATVVVCHHPRSWTRMREVTKRTHAIWPQGRGRHVATLRGCHIYCCSKTC